MAIIAIPTRNAKGKAVFKVILLMLREIFGDFFEKYFR
jgi:hypothetical protein